MQATFTVKDGIILFLCRSPLVLHCAVSPSSLSFVSPPLPHFLHLPFLFFLPFYPLYPSVYFPHPYFYTTSICSSTTLHLLFISCPISLLLHSPSSLLMSSPVLPSYFTILPLTLSNFPLILLIFQPLPPPPPPFPFIKHSENQSEFNTYNYPCNVTTLQVYSRCHRSL